MTRTREAHQGEIDITDVVPADGRATLCTPLRLRRSEGLSVRALAVPSPRALEADGQEAAHRGGSTSRILPARAPSLSAG